MNRQKLFNQALDCVMNQGMPAVDCDGTGVLMDEEGRRCAVGHCLTEAMAKKWATDEVVWLRPAAAKYLKVKYDKDKRFLAELQDAHDNAFIRVSMRSKGDPIKDPKAMVAFREEFIENMKEVAADYKLDFVWED